MHDFFSFCFSYFWLILFIILVVIEISTYNLTTIWFALSCIPLIFLSKLGWRYQLLIFVTLSTLFLAFTRPLVLKKLKQKKNPNDLTGKKIIVTKKVTELQNGEGKTQNGVIWNIVSSDGGEIEPETMCEIVKVSGNTLTVKPVCNAKSEVKKI